MNLSSFHHLAHMLHKKNIPILPAVIYYIQFFLFNSSVPYKCKIGHASKFAYGGIGVVIHERASIGKNCIIGQGITIGGKSKIYDVPKIGDNVYIGAGARILGNVQIGNNVAIGANAVVVDDVPSGCVVAGIPAKIIRSNLTEDDMRDF